MGFWDDAIQKKKAPPVVASVIHKPSVAQTVKDTITGLPKAAVQVAKQNTGLALQAPKIVADATATVFPGIPRLAKGIKTGDFTEYKQGIANMVPHKPLVSLAKTGKLVINPEEEKKYQNFVGGFTGGDMAGKAKKVVQPLVAQAKPKPVFEGFNDLSTKTLEKLKGRDVVSRQYIEDLTNQPDLKQAERDLIRKTLEGETQAPFAVRKTSSGAPLEADVARNTWKRLTDLRRDSLEEAFGNTIPEKVTIYHAGPKDIEPGVYVTSNKDYAAEFAQPGEKIYSKEVSLDDLKAWGDGRVVGKNRHTGSTAPEFVYDPRSSEQVSVPDFAQKVKGELLPLNRKGKVDQALEKERNEIFSAWEKRGIDITKARDSYPNEVARLEEINDQLNTADHSYFGGPKYENINLPSELRGPVADYREHIYESPIKTSAGNVHFHGATEGYFGHTRVEDLPSKIAREHDEMFKGTVEYDPDFSKTAPGNTRRVIELQSDLFQKGRLEEEGNLDARGDFEKLKEQLKAYNIPLADDAKAGWEQAIARQDELEKLGPYRNTWHERLIKEEVKQAAIDGKTKLQFPTGETAMKIEGLGDSQRTWSIYNDADEFVEPLRVDNLQVGQRVDDGASGDWIITDVLGDGKFTAIPKGVAEQYAKRINTPLDEVIRLHQKDPIQNLDVAEEAFDISGKIDTENPIYKFYEKNVGKYLASKYGAKRVKDAQGVEWWEIDVKPDAKDRPIEAFGMGAGIQQDEEGNVQIDPTAATLGILGVAALNRSGAVKLIDHLISKGLVRVVRRGQYDVYQVKKGGKWVNTRDEASAIKQAQGKPKAPPSLKVQALEEELSSLKLQEQLIKDAMVEHPGRALMKYRSTATGDLPYIERGSKSKFGSRGDVIGQDTLGQNASGNGDYDVMNDHLSGYLSLRDQAQEVRDAARQLRAELMQARAENKGLPKIKYSQEGVPLAYTPREKSIVQTGRIPADTLPTSLQGAPQIPQKTAPSPLSLAENQRPVSPARIAPAAKPLEEGEARSLELLAQRQSPKLPPTPPGKTPGRDSLEDMIEQTPVKNKVNLLDYLRTPDRVLKKIGLEKEAAVLRKQHDKYIVELPKNINKITEWQKRVGPMASTRIFKYLDGEAITLAPREKEVAMEIKEWLATWADRLNLPKDKRIAHYITHLFDDQIVKREFDEDLAKIIADKIPGQVYDPFLEARLGKQGYKQDVWAALDAYVKRATRKVHMDPVLEKIESMSTKFEDSQYEYVRKYIAHINMRPTKIDNLIDTLIKSSPVEYKLGQRPTLKITRVMRQMVYRAMLGLNPGSALRNIMQGANTYSKLGEKYTVIGYTKLFSPSARKELMEQGIYENGFIEDRVLSVYKKAEQKMDKTLFVFFDAAEKVNRGAAYLGAKSRGLSKGMSEEAAIDYAKKIVRQTQFNYDKLDTSLLMQPDVVKTGFQFGTYPLKQSEFLLEMMKDKDIAGLARYSGASLLFIATIGQAMGMDWTEAIPGIRFGAPPATQTAWEATKALADAPDKYGEKRTTEEKLSDVGSSALKSMVPAGTQLSKSYGGLKAVRDGAVTDKNGKPLYEAGGSPLKDAQLLMFGKSSSSEAKAHFKPDESDEREMTKTYKQVQKLVAEGKEDEARAIVDSLTDEQYTAYKSVKSAQKKIEAGKKTTQMIKTVREVQDMVSEGRKDEAQALVEAMSEDDYKAYKAAKKLIDEEPQEEKDFIKNVITYAHAIGTDPITAFDRIKTGQYIRRVDGGLFGGAIIVKRMDTEQSQKIAKERGDIPGKNGNEMFLDHVIPLQLGGSNAENNLKLITKAEWDANTPVENHLGKLLRDKKISKKDAQNLITRFKNGEITREEIMNRK